MIFVSVVPRSSIEKDATMTGPKKSVKKQLKMYFPLGRNIFGDVLTISGVSYLKLSVFKTPPSTKGGRQRVLPSSTFYLCKEEFRRLCLLQDRIVKQFSQLSTKIQSSKPRASPRDPRLGVVEPWWPQQEMPCVDETEWRKNPEIDDVSDSSQRDATSSETYNPRNPLSQNAADQNYYPTTPFYTPQATPTYAPTG